MRAGDLTHKVTIESTTETLNSRGDPIDSAPTTVATWWARYEEIEGSEGQAAGEKAFATVRAHWKGHYLPGITTKMKLNEGGVLHDIERVDESQRVRASCTSTRCGGRS
jgi:head-tail adaptor